MTEVGVRERLVTFLESLGYETLYSSPGYSNHGEKFDEIKRSI